jgi:hypothetical protein
VHNLHSCRGDTHEDSDRRNLDRSTDYRKNTTALYCILCDLNTYTRVRVRTVVGPKKKRPDPARRPRRDWEILGRCMRPKSHTNERIPVKARSLCYAEILPPAPPRHEGQCVNKVSMICSPVWAKDATAFYRARIETLFGCHVWALCSCQVCVLQRRVRHTILASTSCMLFEVFACTEAHASLYS